MSMISDLLSWFKPNRMFLGRPDYKGPKKGWFGLLHHDQLYEKSHDVSERVAYVKANKPPHEVKIRLHNMIYLGGCKATVKCDALEADYLAKHQAIDADYLAKCNAIQAIGADYLAKHQAIDADYLAKCNAIQARFAAKRDVIEAEILAYIRKHIPDCAWNEEIEKLEFPS